MSAYPLPPPWDPSGVVAQPPTYSQSQAGSSLPPYSTLPPLPPPYNQPPTQPQQQQDQFHTFPLAHQQPYMAQFPASPENLPPPILHPGLPYQNLAPVFQPAMMHPQPPPIIIVGPPTTWPGMVPPGVGMPLPNMPGLVQLLPGQLPGPFPGTLQMGFPPGVHLPHGWM
jgi:hypothetical protein